MGQAQGKGSVPSVGEGVLTVFMEEVTLTFTLVLPSSLSRRKQKHPCLKRPFHQICMSFQDAESSVETGEGLG